METCPLLTIECSPSDCDPRHTPHNKSRRRRRIAIALSVAALAGGAILLVAAARRPSVLAEYDAAAATYDARWREYLNTSVEYALDRMRPDIEALECTECTVLDIGCGTGALASALAARHPTWNVICADSCKLMLREARRKGVSTRYAYAEHLPLDDESVDLVVSASSFHFWHDRGAGLREAHRVLGPRGRIFVLDWAGDYIAIKLLGAYLHLAGYPREDGDVLTLKRAEALVRDAGFALERAAGPGSFRVLPGVRMRVFGLPVGPSWVVMSLSAVKQSAPLGAASPAPARGAAAGPPPLATRVAAAQQMTGKAAGVKHPAVAIASMDELAQAVVASSAPWLIEFFDPRCGSCRAFMPVWKELVSAGVRTSGAAPAVRFAAVDVSSAGGMELARRFGALEHGLPHVQLIFPPAHGTALTQGVTVPLASRDSDNSVAASEADSRVSRPADDVATARALRKRILELLPRPNQ